MEQSVYKPKTTIITAFVLFFLDAFVMNQGAISIILILIIVFWWLPKSALIKYKKKSPKIPLTKAGVYGLMAIMVLSANFLNNKIAKNRANDLILVVEQYHKSMGKYPEKLTDLVPRYIPRIPSAKYTLGFNEFWYISLNDSVSLFYVDLPPFGRPTYSFNRKAWGYID